MPSDPASILLAITNHLSENLEGSEFRANEVDSIIMIGHISPGYSEDYDVNKVYVSISYAQEEPDLAVPVSVYMISVMATGSASSRLNGSEMAYEAYSLLHGFTGLIEYDSLDDPPERHSTNFILIRAISPPIFAEVDNHGNHTWQVDFESSVTDTTTHRPAI